jgi:hypothetical protein
LQLPISSIKSNNAETVSVPVSQNMRGSCFEFFHL